MDRARRLLIASSPGERWLLGLAGERLVRVEIERLRSPDRVGEVHAARVTAIARGLGGAFVRLGDGAEAFLPAEEADPARPDGGPIRPVEASVRKGEIVVVRIVRAAMGGKGLRVSRRSVENVAGASPPAGPALLAAAPPRALSFVAEEPQAEEILCDDAALVALLKAQGSRIGDRVRHHRGPAPLLDPSLEAEVAALAEPVARLADGMALHVAITPGATVIDVDVTGGPGRETPWRRREAANRAAVREAARQIMLRNLGGVDPGGSGRPAGAARRARVAGPGDARGAGGRSARTSGAGRVARWPSRDRAAEGQAAARRGAGLGRNPVSPVRDDGGVARPAHAVAGEAGAPIGPARPSRRTSGGRGAGDGGRGDPVSCDDAHGKACVMAGRSGAPITCLVDRG
ncbi:MAG: ribonuclease E/G [Acetobacteraceae bacterium]|nr:ribonuclease E/G [Acetobacteraceae bacterium]